MHRLKGEGDADSFRTRSVVRVANFEIAASGAQGRRSASELHPESKTSNHVVGDSEGIRTLIGLIDSQGLFPIKLRSQ